MHTAVGELARTGIDALRGLGFTFYQADRLTHPLTWAEAVHHRAFRFLRLMEPRIRDAMARPFAWQERRNGETTLILLDAAGKSALEAGARALDLVNAEARRTGRGVVMVRDSFGGFLLSALVPQSLDRQLPILVLSRAHVEGEAASEFDQSQAFMGLTLPDRRYIGCRSAHGSAGKAGLGPPFGEFQLLLEDMCGAAVGAEIQRFLDSTPARPTFGTDFVLVSSLAPEGDDQSAWNRRLMDRFERGDSSTRDGAPPGFGATDDLQARWTAALAEGLGVEDQDWENVFKLVARIRIPTSERSRTHAG